MTRAQALAAYPLASTHGHPAETFFTVEPEDIRVGFLSNLLARHLTAAEVKRYKGKVIWTSTANPYYHMGSIRSGATLKATEKAFPHGNLFHVGKNDWYIVHTGKVAATFKVVGGIVKEVGFGTLALNETRSQQRRFITSFWGS
jgi:hypothetical protein